MREGKARQSQGAPAVGKRVRVTWDDGKKYKGMVLETKAATRTCTVLYDDGDVYWEENYSDSTAFELVHEPIVEKSRVEAVLAALNKATPTQFDRAGLDPEVHKLHMAALASAKRRRRTQAAPEAPGAPTVGKRVNVRFVDGKDYSCLVLDYDATTKMSTVIFDDTEVAFDEGFKNPSEYKVVPQPAIDQQHLQPLLAAIQKVKAEGEEAPGELEEVKKLHKVLLSFEKQHRQKAAGPSKPKAGKAKEAETAPAVSKPKWENSVKSERQLQLEQRQQEKEREEQRKAAQQKQQQAPAPRRRQAQQATQQHGRQRLPPQRLSPSPAPAPQQPGGGQAGKRTRPRNTAPAANAKDDEPQCAATKRQRTGQRGALSAFSSAAAQQQARGAAAADAEPSSPRQDGRPERKASLQAKHWMHKTLTSSAGELEAEAMAVDNADAAAAAAAAAAAGPSRGARRPADGAAAKRAGAAQSGEGLPGRVEASRAPARTVSAPSSPAHTPDGDRKAVAKPQHRFMSAPVEGAAAGVRAVAAAAAAAKAEEDEAAAAAHAAVGAKRRTGKRKASEEAEGDEDGDEGAVPAARERKRPARAGGAQSNGGAGSGDGAGSSGAGGAVKKGHAGGKGKLVDTKSGKEERVNLADFEPGQQTGHYTRLFDENGVQLTTSCHHCQHQHVRWLCHKLGDAARRKFERHDGFVNPTSGTEKLQHPSYCKTCIKTYYPDKAFDTLQACCPRCSGWCSCRDCLRKCTFKPPQPGREERVACAQYVLACGGKWVQKVLEQQDAEAAQDGLKLEEVEVNELLNLQRVLCNMCATCIVDLHRHCSSCKWDVCTACCQELRTQQGLPAGAPLVCPNAHCEEDATVAAAEAEAEARAEAAAAAAAEAVAGTAEQEEWQEAAPKQQQQLRRRRARHQEDEAAADQQEAHGAEQTGRQQQQQQQGEAAGADWNRDGLVSKPVTQTSMFRALLAGKEELQPQLDTAAAAMQNGNGLPEPAPPQQVVAAQPMEGVEQPTAAVETAAAAAAVANTAAVVAETAAAANGDPQPMEADKLPSANGDKAAPGDVQHTFAEIGAVPAQAPLPGLGTYEQQQQLQQDAVQQQNQQGEQQQQVAGQHQQQAQLMQDQQLPRELQQQGQAAAQQQQQAGEQYVRPRLVLGRFRNGETLENMRRIAQEYADMDPAAHIPFPAPTSSASAAAANTSTSAAAAHKPAADTSDGAAASNGDAAATSNGNPGPDGAAPDTANGSAAGTSSANGTSTSAGSGSTDWWRPLPQEWRRKASTRGQQDFLYTPHVSDLEHKGDRGKLAKRVFCERWRAGEPIIVRGITPTMSWDPQTMLRATRDQKHNKNEEFAVIDCADGRVFSGNMDSFFKGYREGRHMEAKQKDGGSTTTDVLLKLKDWPPGADFQERLGRHFQDFLEMLPMPLYTLPQLDSAAAPLNLAAALQEMDNPTDLGPKTYVAYGRIKEVEGEGDSVTKLHQDMTDAVNMLLHAQYAANEAAGAARCGDDEAAAPTYGGAGAVWDITRRADVAALRAYMTSSAGEFVHQGAAVDMASIGDVVFDQKFMLGTKHRAALKEQHGVDMWHFEQHVGEAVFIPGGCPHQVRNLRSCIKVAVDFVSPESLGEALDMAQLLRRADMAQPESRLRCAPESEDRHYQEKLQSGLILMRGMLAAWDVLHGNAADDSQQAAPSDSKEGSKRSRAGNGAEGGRSSRKARGSRKALA